jgi:hypothetical protein
MWHFLLPLPHFLGLLKHMNRIIGTEHKTVTTLGKYIIQSSLGQAYLNFEVGLSFLLLDNGYWATDLLQFDWTIDFPIKVTVLHSVPDYAVVKIQYSLSLFSATVTIMPVLLS